MQHQLRALREAKGLTQEQLATRAGLSRVTVVRHEQGKAIDSDTISAYCSALDCSPNALLGYDAQQSA